MRDKTRQDELVELASEGNSSALGRLLASEDARLRRMLRLRLDRRLRGRVSVSDVLQESYLEASRRFAEWVANPRMPFFLWLRWIANERLLMAHRHHLDARARAVDREVSIHGGAYASASSVAIAAQLLDRHTTPTQAAMRAELKTCILDALEALEPLDREILALRHFEQLTNTEAADVLRIHKDAASKRYVRALRRLRKTLTETFGDGTAAL